MRQPTPTEPSPRALEFFFSGAGTHELPNPLGWVPKMRANPGGQMPCPQSTLQHFSLTAQKSSNYLITTNQC